MAPFVSVPQIFSNLLIYVNSSTNFIIFAVMGERFRKVLCQSLCKTKKERRRLARQHRLKSLDMLRNISAISLQTAGISVSSCSTTEASGSRLADIERLTTLPARYNSRHKACRLFDILRHAINKIDPRGDSWVLKHSSGS